MPNSQHMNLIAADLVHRNIRPRWINDFARPGSEPEASAQRKPPQIGDPRVDSPMRPQSTALALRTQHLLDLLNHLVVIHEFAAPRRRAPPLNGFQ